MQSHESSRARSVLPWAALVLAAALGCAFRAAALERLSPRDFSYFVESGFRFRQAEMRMQGRAPPALDRDAQWPEGHETARQSLPLADRVAAAVHARRGGDTFLAARAAVIGFSTLAVAAFALLALALLRSPWSAAAATLVYAGTFGAWSRSLGNYLREDFALPGLLLAAAGATWLLFGELGRRGRVAAGLAGVVGAAWSGSCWHMAQFCLALLGALIVVTGLSGRPRRAAQAGLALWLGLALAALSNEALRSKGALWNVASALTLAPALASGLSRWLRRPDAARGALAGVATLLVGAALLAGRSPDYAHVYELVRAKLVHLGRHPGPQALSPDARLFWTGPFDSPDALELYLDYGLLLLPIGLGLALAARDAARRRSPRVAFLAAAGLGTLALYLLMGRMTVLLAPWAAVLAVRPAFRPVRLRWRALAGGLVGLALVANAYGGLEHFNVGGRYHRAVTAAFDPQPPDTWYYGTEREAVLRWLAAAPPGAVLTDFAISPLVLTLTGKPIVLHPMFEVARMRSKVVEHADAALGDEEALYELCRRWDVGYVVHFARQVLSDGPRSFLAIAASEPAPGSAAWAMQFAPRSLARFRLAFETCSMRVFQVGRGYDGYAATAYHPLFDPARFPAPPDERTLDAFYRDVHAASQAYGVALGAQAAGDLAAAVAGFEQALRLHPDFEEANLRLGACRAALGQVELAREALERAARAGPADPRPRELLGQLPDE